MTLPNNVLGNQYGIARAKAEGTATRNSDIGGLVGLGSSEGRYNGDRMFNQVSSRQGRAGDQQDQQKTYRKMTSRRVP